MDPTYRSTCFLSFFAAPFEMSKGFSGLRVDKKLTRAVGGCGCEVYRAGGLGYEDHVPAKLPPETSPSAVKYIYI